MKKKLLLSIFVASLFVTSALCLNACKKDADGDIVPTEVTILRGATDSAMCIHCNRILHDRYYYCYDPAGPHMHPEDPYVFHRHEYMEGDTCRLVQLGYICKYNRRHHKHEVYYMVNPVSHEDHYQDDWIHIGGGGGGE